MYIRNIWLERQIERVRFEYIYSFYSSPKLFLLKNHF
jgi:hypothetical protein